MRLTKEQRKLFARVGKQGGKIIKEKYGMKHYKRMAKIRWDKYKAEQVEKKALVDSRNSEQCL